MRCRTSGEASNGKRAWREWCESRESCRRHERHGCMRGGRRPRHRAGVFAHARDAAAHAARQRRARRHDARIRRGRDTLPRAQPVARRAVRRHRRGLRVRAQARIAARQRVRRRACRRPNRVRRPRCLNDARRELFLCVATKLSQHAIIVVVRNDNGNRARPTTKKCRMSSDCNSARVARCIDAFRFRTFLDVDCIGASGARPERPDSPAVRVESGTRRDGRLD